MSNIRLTWEWLAPPDPEVARGPDRFTWASLEVSLGGERITSYNWWGSRSPVPDGDAVVGGMAGLCDWIVENWQWVLWEIHTPFPKTSVGELAGAKPWPTPRQAASGWPALRLLNLDLGRVAQWQHRHSFGHGSSSLALPSLILVPEVRTVGVVVDHPPTIQLEPNVKFSLPGPLEWPHDPVWIPKDGFVSELGGFVTAVIARAAEEPSCSGWVKWMNQRWQAQQAAVHDMSTRRALLYGDLVSRKWGELELELGRSIDALSGLLVDVPPVEKESMLEGLLVPIRSLEDAAQNAPWVEASRHKPDRSLPSYEQGYRLAIAARSILKNDSGPMADISGQMNALGVQVKILDGENQFRTAVVSTPSGNASILVNKADSHISGIAPYRFAVAAALGRLIAEGGKTPKAFGAAHGPQSRWLETQRANAFAAEFLLPRSAMGTDSDPGDLSERFGIARSAAQWHCRNRLAPPV